MKNILTLLLLLVWGTAQAQQTDSLVLGEDRGTFYIDNYKKSGSTTIKTTTVRGDSASCNHALVGTTYQRSAPMASDARIVSTFRSDINYWLRFLSSAQDKIGNPLDSIVISNERLLLNEGWLICLSPKDTIPLEFFVQDKVLYWSTDRFNLSPVDHLGNIMRLANFNGDDPLDVYSFGNGIWSNIDRTVAVIQPEITPSSLNGFFDKEDTDNLPSSDSTLNDDGSVTITSNGVTSRYTYDGHTKRWLKAN